MTLSQVKKRRLTHPRKCEVETISYETANADLDTLFSRHVMKLFSKALFMTITHGNDPISDASKAIHLETMGMLSCFVMARCPL